MSQRDGSRHWCGRWRGNRNRRRRGSLRRARSSVWLNCCCANGRHQEASPSNCLGLKIGEERVVLSSSPACPATRRRDRAGSQINRRRKLRQQVIRQVESRSKRSEVASLLLLQLVNLKMRKHHAPSAWLGCGSGRKPRGRDPGRGSDPGSAPPASPSWYLPAA